ncbi:MAG: DNA-J related domain-containing protein [bacterium]
MPEKPDPAGEKVTLTEGDSCIPSANLPHNPFKTPILALLLASEKPLGIHEMTLELRRDGILPSLPLDELELFRVNFLLMNALYALQPEGALLGWRLHISPLANWISEVGSPQGSAAEQEALLMPAGEVELRNYYMNWSNLEQTSLQEVEDLLHGFWERYAALGDEGDARKVLGIDGSCDEVEIRRAYQRAIGRCHPDRGGEAQDFIRVRRAYEVLCGGI